MRCKQFIIVSLASVVLAASLASCGGTVPASSAAASSVAASSVVASSAAAEAALPDGVYTADFETDSSMFHPNEACNGKGTLTVENGVMTFHVSLASKKIVNLYPGLAADAEANKTAWLIPTVDTVTYADGTTEEVYGYDIPVEALDTDFQLAILGTKGTWYDHTVSVRNTGRETLRFGLGFHPGFTLPFDDKHTDADYDILFDTVESPLCLNTAPNGLIGAAPDYYLARNVTRIPLSAELFARDSHCMVNLKSKSICVLERDTGRRIRVDIENFPYTLIWSTPQKPMRFICVEPWHSIPGEDNGPIEWAQKPCAASLEPDDRAGYGV